MKSGMGDAMRAFGCVAWVAWSCLGSACVVADASSRATSSGSRVDEASPSDGFASELVRAGTSRNHVIESVVRGTDASENETESQLVAREGTARNTVAAPVAAANQAAVAQDVAKALADLTALKGAVDDLMARYMAYKTTDADATARLVTLSHLAEQATLESLDAVELQIEGFQQEEDQKVFALLDTVPELRAKLRAVRTALDGSVARFADLGTVGAWQRQAIRNLNELIEYCEARRERSDQGVMVLMTGTRARRQALVAERKEAEGATN
jgi:hypothetical protein